ncbi:MAG TPA: protoporphyrinogen oxidase HemJ [Rickettsiales bacterium]|nr:protoporphyrinogen oxidase HemJ [Rickettsiales bacterium]
MYLWVKALHIISVISWMAGMLYLPRLYVYHASLTSGSEASELLKVMERRLLRYIINPAMIATWGFGIWLITILGWDYVKTAHWLHAKLMLVILMQLVHAMLARCRRNFANDHNTKTPKFYRILNESVTLLMIGIVILVVVQPF